MAAKISGNAGTGLQEEERDILFGVINRFIGYFTRESQRESRNDETLEYPFVPMDTRQTFTQLQLARTYLAKRDQEPRQYTFIDIGCGIGNVLLFAEQFDFHVFGIEKDDYPFQVARKLHGDEVLPEDIWNYEGYNNFDVIYYFRPFHDRNTQCRFELFIEDHLKPGGILIANRKMSEAIHTDPRFLRLDPDLPVWEKKVMP